MTRRCLTSQQNMMIKFGTVLNNLIQTFPSDWETWAPVRECPVNMSPAMLRWCWIKNILFEHSWQCEQLVIIIRDWRHGDRNQLRTKLFNILIKKNHFQADVLCRQLHTFIVCQKQWLNGRNLNLLKKSTGNLG